MWSTASAWNDELLPNPKLLFYVPLAVHSHTQTHTHTHTHIIYIYIYIYIYVCVCVCVWEKEWNEYDRIYVEKMKHRKNIYWCSFDNLLSICFFGLFLCQHVSTSKFCNPKTFYQNYFQCEK